MDNIFAIVGLDADTILDQNCVYELMKELRFVKLPSTYCSPNSHTDTQKPLESVVWSTSISVLAPGIPGA